MACQSSFNIFIMPGYLEAYVNVHPDDRLQVVGANREFTIRATYILGSPNVLDVPFLVTPREFSGGAGSDFDVPAGFEVISITPEKPNFTGVQANTEQNLVVTAIVREEEDDSPSDDDAPVHYFYVDVSSFQPPEARGADFGEGEIVSDSLSNIPNMRLNEFGDYAYVSWDLPEDEHGVDIPVDVRLRVSFPDPDGASTFYRVGTPTVYFNMLWENITVGAEQIGEIIDNNRQELNDYFGYNAAGIEPTLEGYGPMKVTVQVKRHGVGHAWTRDSVDVDFDYPLRRTLESSLPHPKDLVFETSNYLDGRQQVQEQYRLEWTQPYWLGDPTGDEFLNLWPQPNYDINQYLAPLGSEITIAYYEYRYKKDNGEYTDWQDVDSVTQFAQWPNTPYTSVRSRVRVFPFGREFPVEAGTYEFQGRAVTSEGVLGLIISTTETIT